MTLNVKVIGHDLKQQKRLRSIQCMKFYVYTHTHTHTHTQREKDRKTHRLNTKESVKRPLIIIKKKQ